MNYTNKTSFTDSLKIQGRVTYALLMREIITRYGRDNIGFFWLFIEPLLITLLIAMVWSISRADQISNLNIIAFAITGYPVAMMWRGAASRMIGAISSNETLLYHRNVRPLDVINARVILEVAGATAAQLLITIVFIFLGIIEFPNDMLYMISAWFLMVLFAYGLGLTVCVALKHFPSFEKIWSLSSLPLLLLSGAFFFVDTLPPEAQKFVLWIPMVHGSEMFRAGYFGNTVTTYENVFYLVTWNIVLILIGLALFKKAYKGS